MAFSADEIEQIRAVVNECILSNNKPEAKPGAEPEQEPEQEPEAEQEPEPEKKEIGAFNYG